MEFIGINDDTIKETMRFVRMFDWFFDMLNTRSLEESTQKKKPDLESYRTSKLAYCVSE